jgi:hypothetical protein
MVQGVARDVGFEPTRPFDHRFGETHSFKLVRTLPLHFEL